MRATFAVLLHALLAPVLLAGQPHITFTRTIPPPINLGQAEVVVLIYALGDNNHLGEFVDVFREKVNGSGTLRLENATQRTQRFIRARADRETAQKLQREEPADAWVGINEFTCKSTQRGGERSVYDADHKRVKRDRVWIETLCTARVDILSAEDLHRVASFEVKGEGASPRVEAITEEERTLAVAEAAKFAAIDAAEHIAPRRIRESLTLAENVADFDEAMRLIALERPADARTVWENALKTKPSAALHYNLGAVCEALGDEAAAEKHYLAARKLQPGEPRYRDELRSFQRRKIVRTP
jgi:tetratricopeptide (TPR) repeat protein